MALKFHPISGYMLSRAKTRADRAKQKIDINYCISVDTMQYDGWDAQLAWLKSQSFNSFTWSPFTGEWRRYFAFERLDHLILFKLTFAGY